MKRFSLLLALFSIAVGSMAQGKFDMTRSVRLGFKIDPGIMMLKPQEEGVTRNSSRFGASFGIMVDFMLNEAETYAIATGLQIVTSGGKLKYDAGKGLSRYNSAPAEYDMRLTHIEIPATLKLKTTPTSSGAAFWGQFGTYLGFPVRARADVVSLNQKWEKQNLIKEVNRINIGLLVGAGVEYPLGERLTGLVGLSYQNGFIDVTRNARWGDGKVNMNSLSLRLGVYF
ncbi:PorT family protein [Chitinophaga pendula]|uniref:porin family protein n=1 Tax=Chitinophaga TaxID=79328 RepID=UPI000BAE83A5|nr:MULTISPECIES: porin family protein [Chitinophaga]ASZ09935.1 hypothetical protein CK934_02535 [Chitinophaga sp. MD30]UCJ07125.1 PorT family protein [Chitinophaga pendula]